MLPLEYFTVQVYSTHCKTFQFLGVMSDFYNRPFRNENKNPGIKQQVHEEAAPNLRQRT